MRLFTTLALLPLLFGLESCASFPPEFPPDQIAWHRSLDDALRVAKQTGRPLFFAVNMDGESASERIVRENYRDPKFVAMTRRCVCVVGSLFRHNARDYDDHGRRIPCPRLGSVTCGEHIALEPELFDKVLKGERVAPRHVFVDPDGKKVFDESLLFDIRDLDRMLADALAKIPATEKPNVARDFEAISKLPIAGARGAMEQKLARASHGQILRSLAAIRRSGDPTWKAALRATLRVAWSQERDEALIATAKAIGTEADLAQALRDQVLRQDFSRVLDGNYLPMLAALDPKAQQTRTWRLARWVTEFDWDGILRPASLPMPTRPAAIEAMLENEGGSIDLNGLLDLAGSVTRASGTLPRPGPTTDAIPTQEVLLQRLEELDRQREKNPQLKTDPKTRAAVAKASLDLARQKMAKGAREIPLLLADAEQQYRLALKAEPKRADWWIEAARTAYFQQEFVRQAECGRQALLARQGSTTLPSERRLNADSKLLNDALAIEALRWIGDAEARLMLARAKAPDEVQAKGMLAAVRALGLVAASPFGRAKDWTSYVSLLESIGLVFESVPANVVASHRYPADAELRQSLRSILWSIRRIDLAPEYAERVLHARPKSATAAWFVGYEYLLLGEDHRRAERPDDAIKAYEEATSAFANAATLDEKLAPSSTHYTGVAWLGRGMAHLLAVRQQPAADALAEAARSGASIRAAKDGLQRDVFDLVDQCLEWRAGRPSPVDALDLLQRLQQNDRGTGFWAGAVSDTMLREGLRADGKNPNRVERDTVGASGETIRMAMGLPTKLGDWYLEQAVAAGRSAVAHQDGDRKPLAQALTITGERALDRLTHKDGAPEELLATARRVLREAAQMRNVPPPSTTADQAELSRTAKALRDQLGPARPRFREGR